MKLLSAVPPQLILRHAPNAVPIDCDCGVSFLWEKALGGIVVCPSCKVAENIDLDGAETRKDPALAVPADKPVDDTTILDALKAPAPVAAAAPGPVQSITPLPPRGGQKMRDIVALPAVLGGMMKALVDDAAGAAAELKSARDYHGDVVGRVRGVARTIRNSAAQSEDIINQMMGGNSPPPGTDTSDGSSKS